MSLVVALAGKQKCFMEMDSDKHIDGFFFTQTNTTHKIEKFCFVDFNKKKKFIEERVLEKKPSSAPELDTSNNGATANLFDRSFVPWVLVNIDPPIDGTVGTRSG